MDPATAIGLVSGILSFVGTAGKVLTLAWTLYNSVEGSLEETETRLKLANSMVVISKHITPTSQSAVTEEDKALVTLAEECNKLTNGINKELQALKPKRRKSKAQSGFAALKTLVIEPKMKDLEKQLERCRDQLHFHIAALSRGDSENVKALLATSKQDGDKLTRLECSITQLRQTLQDMATTEVDSISDQALDQLKVLLQVGQDALNEVAQDRILRGIKAGFKDMFYRYQDVQAPFGETFEWIFDFDGNSPEAVKFTQWISSGDGIFHICSKLGSGKSTLMKKLCEHERTRSELEKWTQAIGGKKLITANFFFYALGSDLRQKSLIGLYRTLLYQILETNPDLIQSLLPDQWTRALSQRKLHSAYDIRDEDIMRAYERLSSQHHNGNSLGEYCFSFFIDGLDEYQTTTSIDRREMVRSLMDLASSASGRFKICVSSRLENPFMDMFSNDTRLYLQDLTKSDMEAYVRGNLRHVGTRENHQQLASSITNKAEGVFLWVVLVVQRIRKLSDDGARFPRLLREIESLPTELNELFQRILDSLETNDRRLLSRIVSLLHFLGNIPGARKMHLWLNLGDFYFLEDFEANMRFAEDTQFPGAGFETVEESEIRARRQLRGVSRGLVEADKAHDLDFTHRSVGDFFKQDKVRINMHDEFFSNVEALSQLKLACVKHYWSDIERQNGNQDDEEKNQEETLNRHSILVACLVEQRRRQQLDVPPFNFLACFDAIPQLSVSTTINRSVSYNKTAFRINLSRSDYADGTPYCDFEICHTSRVRHRASEAIPGSKLWSESTEAKFDGENSPVLWRDADEEVDHIEEYSVAVISPLFTEICSGRWEYPCWRMAHIQDMPLESDKLAMLVYCAIGSGIGRLIWKRKSTASFASEGHVQLNLAAANLVFLRHLFEQNIVSPNSLLHLAFGGEFGFIRIAAGNQRLSIWQHFLCWWVTVAAACGDFISEGVNASDDSSLNDPSELTDSSESNGEEPFNSPDEQYAVGFVLETFIKNGADLQLKLGIEDGGYVPRSADDMWYSYILKMSLDGREALELDVVLNINTRMSFDTYPYRVPNERIWHVWHERASQALPKSPLSVKDWIDRSRLPNKDVLFKLMNENSAR